MTMFDKYSGRNPVIGMTHLRFEASNELDEHLLQFYESYSRRKLGSRALYLISDHTELIIDGYSDFTPSPEAEHLGLSNSEVSRLDKNLLARRRQKRALSSAAGFKRLDKSSSTGLRIELRVIIDPQSTAILRDTAFIDGDGTIPVHHDIPGSRRADGAALLAARDGLSQGLAGERPLNVDSLELMVDMTERPSRPLF